MRLNLPALLLSLLIVGGGILWVATGMVMPRSIGFLTGGESAGLRQSAPELPCSRVERGAGGAYVFASDCGGYAPSPDGRLVIVKNGTSGSGVGLVRAASGASLDDLGMLDDGRGFAVFWSARPYWFFANQGKGRLRVFQLVNGALVQRPAAPEVAAQAFRERAPCLAAQDVAMVGAGWSGDGTRLAMLVQPGGARCGEERVAGLWLIADPVTGAIEPESIREHRAGDGFPSDGPYASF